MSIAATATPGRLIVDDRGAAVVARRRRPSAALYLVMAIGVAVAALSGRDGALGAAITLAVLGAPALWLWRRRCSWRVVIGGGGLEVRAGRRQQRVQLADVRTIAMVEGEDPLRTYLRAVSRAVGEARDWAWLSAVTLDGQALAVFEGPVAETRAVERLVNRALEAEPAYRARQGREPDVASGAVHREADDDAGEADDRDERAPRPAPPGRLVVVRTGTGARARISISLRSLSKAWLAPPMLVPLVAYGMAGTDGLLAAGPVCGLLVLLQVALWFDVWRVDLADGAVEVRRGPWWPRRHALHQLRRLCVLEVGKTQVKVCAIVDGGDVTLFRGRPDEARHVERVLFGEMERDPVRRLRATD